MADIFISYAREDRAIAERLASAIEASGKTVWWDRHIKGGAQFAKDIERELHAAEHVVVLWSAASVESRWVRDEASHAADGNRLIGASIDGTPAPLGFGQFHTVDLQEWIKTGAALPEELAEAFGAEPVAPSTSAPAVGKRRRPLLIGGIAAALAAVGIGAVALDVPAVLSGEQQSQDVIVAILPFGEPGGDTALGRTMASVILDGLGDGQGFDLISSTSSFAAQESSATASDIAARLGATHIVEGDLRQVGDALHLTMRIVDGASGRPIWTHTVEQSDGKREELSARAANRLSAALQAWLGVGSGTTGDLDGVPEGAIAEYRKGMEELLAADGPDAYLGAFQHFNSAVDRAPDWAAAYSAQGLALMQFGPRAVALEVDEFIALQENTFSKALELDPGNPMALTAQAGHMLYVEGEIGDAIEQLEAVIEDHPDLSQPRAMLATAYVTGGHYREALTQIDRALSLAPPTAPALDRIRTDALRGLDRRNDIIRMGRECRAQCYNVLIAWYEAMLSAEDVSEAGVERNIEQFDEALIRDDTSEELRAQIAATIRYWHLDGPKPSQPFLVNAMGAIFAAREGDLDEAFDQLAFIADPGTPAVVATMVMYDDKLSIPEEMRRDPRYAELFDKGRFYKVEAYRRKQGNLAGLPIREGD